MPDDRFEKAPEDTRPWHQKSPYAGVKTDPHELWVVNGKLRQGVNHTFTAEAVQEIHDGRRCGECHEPQIAKAWPKKCSLCGNDFRLMYDRFMKRWAGEEWVGTSIDFRAEMDRLDSELEQDNWESTHTSSGIVLPRGVST